MTKVKFDYDIKKDAWWWASLARDKDLWGMSWKNEVAPIPDQLIKDMNKVSKQEAEKLALNHLKTRKLQDRVEIMIDHEKEALNKAWKEVEKDFFAELAKLFKAPIYRDSFKAYFTSLFICPYNADEHWFMVSVWKSLPWQIGTVCHEIMHLQFINQYQDYLLKEKKITKEKFEEIKEAMAILLNEEQFKDIVLVEEQGYPDHQETIKKIEKLRKEGKSIKEIVEVFT